MVNSEIYEPKKPHIHTTENEERQEKAIPIQWEDDPAETYSKDLTSRCSQHLKSVHLQKNLMREQKERDPLYYYEILEILGVGSMGSVSRVKKRDHVVGGSARKEVVDSLRKASKNSACVKIPLIGSIVDFYSQRSFSNSQRSWESFNSPNQNAMPQSSFRSLVASLSGRSNILETFDESGSGAKRKTHGQYEMIYALKSIHLNRVTDETFLDELRNEIEILKTLDHPHIVRPIETFEHRNQLFMVMECCSGGDLYSRDPYTEEQAARIINSILSAVSYMHEHTIVHRDLKYENILFVNNSPHAEIKIIDFGLSKKYIAACPTLSEGVGTIYTIAPEVLIGSYNSQADLWSIGVIAFMLLSSQMPFYGRKRKHIVDLIMRCKYSFKSRRWKNISVQAQNFVRDLLILKPEDRATAEDAFASTWLNRRHGATTRGPVLEEISDVQSSLKAFTAYSKLKRLALTVIAHKSTSEEIGILRKVFEQYDTNRKGIIDFDRFKMALAESGCSDSELEIMFEAVDLDGSGKIRYTEFLAATIEARGAIKEERLAEAFDRLDSDDSGYISAENLRDILGSDLPALEIDEIIRECDLTKDNRISYQEFLVLMELQIEDQRLTEMNKLKIDASKLSNKSEYFEFGSQLNLNDRSRNQSFEDSTEERESSMARANDIQERNQSER